MEPRLFWNVAWRILEVGDRLFGKQISAQLSCQVVKEDLNCLILEYGDMCSPEMSATDCRRTPFSNPEALKSTVLFQLPSIFDTLRTKLLVACLREIRKYSHSTYEGWNFNFGNAAITFDTAHLQSSYFHRPSTYSPKLCRTRSQRWGSRMMPFAAPVLLMVRTERSTAEGLNPPCNCPIW